MRSHLPVRKFLALVVLSAGLSASADAITVDRTYSFPGTCSVDCTGTGTGTLVLSGYTLSSSLAHSNFVSFSYSLNFLSYSITSPELVDLIGTPPSSLAAFASVFIEGNSTIFGNSTTVVFTSSTTGSWCAGGFGVCAADSGTNGIWSSGVPEPATYLSMLLTGGALFVLRRKR